MPPALLTLEQYDALPESRRAEVFDGVVYDMASPLPLSSLTLW